jgi:hypothetical protein
VALLPGVVASGTLVAAQALCRTARLKARANLTRFMVFTSMLRGIPCSCREALSSQAVSKMSRKTSYVSKTFIEVDLKRAGNQGVFYRLFIGSYSTIFESGGFVLLTEFLLPRVYAESPACQFVLGVGISTRIGESSYRHL